MPTYTFSNATDTNLRDANGANITTTATVYALIGTIGTSFTLEKFENVAINQGEMSVTTVGTATRFIVGTGASQGLFEAP